LIAQNFRIFIVLQSKSVNCVSKLLQLLGDFVPRLPTSSLPLDLHSRPIAL